MPADIIGQWQAYINSLLPVIQTTVLVMLKHVGVCEYAFFFFTSAFTISARQTCVPRGRTFDEALVKSDVLLQIKQRVNKP